MSESEIQLKEDIWVRWAAFLSRHALVCAIITLTLTLTGAYFSKKLGLETNLKRLLPDHYNSVKTLNTIVDRLGGTGTIEYLVDSNSWDQTMRFAEDLHTALAKRSDVKFVEFRRPVEFLKKNRLLYLSIEDLEKLYSKVKKRINKEKLKKSELVVDFRTEEEKAQSKDDNELKELEDKYQEYVRLTPFHQDDKNRYILIKVHPAVSQTDIKGSKALYQSMEQVWKDVKNSGKYDSSVTVNIRGSIRNRILEYDTILRDVNSSTWITGTITFLLLLFCFRNILWVGCVLLAFPVCVALTFGIVYFVYGSLNLLTVFLFLVLFGLGIDYGILMLSRYLEDRARGLTGVQALSSMFKHAGHSCFTAGISTAMGFLTLLFTDFRGFSEFGFIIGAGIPLALICMYTTLPLCILIIERFLGRWLSYRLPTSFEPKTHGRPFPAAKLFVFASLLMIGIGIYMATKLEFEYDFSRLRTNPPESEEINAKYSAIPRESNSPAITVAETPEEAKEIKAALEEKMALDTQTPTIQNVRIASDIVPEQQAEKIEILKDLDTLLTEKTMSNIKDPDDQRRIRELKESSKVRTPFTIKDVPEDLLLRFRDINDKLVNFVFIYNSVELVDGRNTLLWYDDVGEIKTKSGKTYYSSSNNIIFAEMLRLMIKDGKKAMLYTFVFLFLMTFLDFKSFNKTALVLNPLTVAIFSLIIFMVCTGQKINFFNMVAFPTLIGMGEDYSVYYTHRYFEDTKKGPLFPLFVTGPGIFFSASTAIVGYVGLVFASHPGLNSLGKVSCMGIFFCFLATFVILPPLLSVFGRDLK